MPPMPDERARLRLRLHHPPGRLPRDQRARRRGADRIQIRLADGRRFEGALVGHDNRVDLALVKIEATGLPVAALGDSNRLRVGEFVLALGHPFGLEQTVSFGIVSRKGAPLQVAAPGFDFIQTDAAREPRQLRRPAGQHGGRGRSA